MRRGVVISVTPEKRLAAYKRNRVAAARSVFERELIKIAEQFRSERDFERQLNAMRKAQQGA